jgi:hypothetical protein
MRPTGSSATAGPDPPSRTNTSVKVFDAATFAVAGASESNTPASTRAVARNPAEPGRAGNSARSDSTAASTEPAAARARATRHHRRDVRSTRNATRPAVARLHLTCSGP